MRTTPTTQKIVPIVAGDATHHLAEEQVAPLKKIVANLATSHNSMRVLLPDQIKKKIPKMTKGL